MTEVKVGQIWRDNYNYGGDGDTQFMRHVKVLSLPAAGFSRVTIRRCHPNGQDMPRSPTTRTEIARFHNGGRNGFTFVKDA